MRPSRSSSEQDLRHSLSIFSGSVRHLPAAARLAQSERRSPRASQRSVFEQVTVSVWLAQMRWMWHEAGQTVAAFLTSVVHPPRSAKLTHESDVSCRMLSFLAANSEQDFLHWWRGGW